MHATTTSRTDPHITHKGFAAEDLEKKSVVLKVICPELIPNSATGTMAAGITNGSVGGLTDRDGKKLQTPYTTANHIVATWCGESNMRYPPMVRAGEPVEVFKTAGQDKYEWRTSGKGREFRTTDRIHFEIGATDPTKPGQPKNDTNTYSAYLDSDQKKVGMKTSKANGEAAAFSMEADLDAGTFHISDDGTSPSNRIFLDTGSKSGTPVFQVNLSSGVVLKMEGGNIFIKTPKMLQIDAGERIVINSPLTVFNLQKTGAIILNAASLAFNSAKETVVTAAIMGINAASTKLSGIILATGGRIPGLGNGPVSGSYRGVSVSDPTSSSVSTPSNTPE